VNGRRLIYITHVSAGEGKRNARHCNLVAGAIRVAELLPAVVRAYSLMTWASRFSLLAATVALVGCAPKEAPKPKVSANDGAASAATSAAEKTQLPIVGPAPDWKLRDLDGRLVTSADFKGKVVVLDFWATWCPPCRKEIPGYIDLYRKYGRGRLAIVGVSLDEGGPTVVKDFVQKFGVNYPVVMGDDAVQNAFGGMEAIPTTFLIDQRGQIRDKKVGAEPTEEYEKKIASLLN
jgi:peroxiredoxin